KGHYDDRGFRRQIMNAHADDFIRVESKRADVQILLIPFGSDKLYKALQQVVARKVKLHQKQLGRLQKAAEMVLGTKNKQLLLILVPIRPETSEYRGSIIHRVHEHAELHFGIRNNAALVKHEVW